MSLYYTSNMPTQAASTNINTNYLLILLHGGALSSSMYHTLIPYLHYDSITPDLPGHGQSAHLGPFTFRNSTTHLKNLLTHLHQQPQHHNTKIILVGISLGAQAALALLTQHPTLIAGAIISGATIHPPSADAAWEMPRMPTDQFWTDTIAHDVGVVGMDAAGALQRESFGFEFSGAVEGWPPVLVCVGENDVAMAKRDFEEVVRLVRTGNSGSRGMVIREAWHNHSIDIPERFARVVDEWVGEVVGGKVMKGGIV